MEYDKLVIPIEVFKAGGLSSWTVAIVNLQRSQFELLYQRGRIPPPIFIILFDFTHFPSS